MFELSPDLYYEGIDFDKIREYLPNLLNEPKKLRTSVSERLKKRIDDLWKKASAFAEAFCLLGEKEVYFSNSLSPNSKSK